MEREGVVTFKVASEDLLHSHDDKRSVKTMVKQGFILRERGIILRWRKQEVSKKGSTFWKVYVIPLLLFNVAVVNWSVIAAHLHRGC